MKAQLIGISLVALAGSLCPAAAVNLQDVNTFPELYAGSPVEIEGVSVEGALKKDSGYFCMGVMAGDAGKGREAIRKGQYCPPYLSMERLSFVAPPVLAKRLLDLLEAGTAYPARLLFTVERTTQLGNAYWIATVTRIVLSSPDGALRATVDESATLVSDTDDRGE